MISSLQAELTNLDSIYTSYRPLILAATQLLKKKPSFDGVSTSNRHTWGSLLPFLGDPLSWLTGTTRTKDVSSIRKRVNQLITAQNTQKETLVHIIFVLNVTTYATQVKRKHFNIVMDTVERAHQDIVTLYNFSSSLHNSMNYQQVILHTCCVLSNFQDSLYYMREVTMHTVDSIDAATTGILSFHILPVEDVRMMLLHIERAIPSTCTYEFHLRIHFISADTYELTL